MGKRQSVSVSDASMPAGGEAGQAGQQVYDHLELLAAMGKDFSSSGDIEASLKCAVEHITEYLNAEGGALFLLDDKGETLRCHACVGPTEITGLTLKCDQGIVGRCVQNEIGEIVRNVTKDAGFHAGIDEQTGYTTRSILCAPMSVKEERIGAIELINKRGVQTSVLITLSGLCGGLLFAALLPDVSWSKGLALASGFGWYSLSGIVMTEAYGPVWGSVALLNDLAREFFALAFIPMLMRRHPSAAVGVGGATSLDFTLPVIQSSGGLAVVPLAISFGFIINVLAPVLMVVFSTAHF
jgi:hypothetical protein